MPTDYLTTDTELTSIANAIRTKGGTSASLTYPTGFVNAINAIPTGGGSGFEDISADFDFSASPTFFIALYNELDAKLVLSGLVEDVYDDVTISYLGGDESVQDILTANTYALFVCDGDCSGSTVYFALDCTATFYANGGQNYFGFYDEHP